MTDFFRFPHTPHLAWLASGTPRDDKVLSPDEAKALLDHAVVVEEKLDGANMGISFNSEGVLHVQNRGQYLNKPYGGQFSRLDEWLVIREDALFDVLGDQLMLFGEWCAAQHSLDYEALPDWFHSFQMRPAMRSAAFSLRSRLRSAKSWSSRACLVGAAAGGAGACGDVAAGGDASFVGASFCAHAGRLVPDAKIMEMNAKRIRIAGI